MQLTHSVTIHDHTKPEPRKLVYAQVNLREELARPIEIARFHPMDEEGTSVCLSWDEFAAVADLVWAHRPDSAINDAETADETCGALGPLDGLPCVLKPGHLPVEAGKWTHITREASKFTRTNECTHNWVTAQDGEGKKLSYMHCGLCGVRRPF